MNTRTRIAAAALAAALWGPALAQQPPGSPRLDHRSAFEGYRPYGDGAELQDWRAANDTVRDAGGWRAYARDAAGAHAGHGEPEPATPGKSSEQDGHALPHPGTAGSHGGHHP